MFLIRSKLMEEHSAGSSGACTNFNDSNRPCRVMLKPFIQVGNHNIPQHFIKVICCRTIFIYAFHQLHGGLRKNNVGGRYVSGQNFRQLTQC
ncbi:hypothetical protein D1872_183530 [compost metagenome]